MLEDEAGRILRKVGMPLHLAGYKYSKTALSFLSECGERTDVSVSEVYNYVAKQHSTTAAKVSHAIRGAIQIAWKPCRQTKLQKKLFAGMISGTTGRPTNSEFLFVMGGHKIKIK